MERVHSRRNDRVIGTSVFSTFPVKKIVRDTMKSASVMVWVTAFVTWKSPLIFTQKYSKIILKTYIFDYLLVMKETNRDAFYEWKDFDVPAGWSDVPQREHLTILMRGSFAALLAQENFGFHVHQIWIRWIYHHGPFLTRKRVWRPTNIRTELTGLKYTYAYTSIIYRFSWESSFNFHTKNEPRQTEINIYEFYL